MADNRKYYYLKLKENFFDSEDIKILESMPNGYMYSNLLLKLYLKSLKFEGALRLNEYIPYNAEMISAITNINIDTVRAGLKILEQLKLIERLEDGTIYMLEIQNFIGQSSTEGDRKRDYRRKIDTEKQNLLTSESTDLGQMSDKCHKNTGQVSGQMSDERLLEIRDKSLEIRDKSLELKDIIIMTSEESEFISVLSKILNYPLDRNKDLEMYKTLTERYPELDLVQSIKDWAIYKQDKPLDTKSNARSQINTSFKNYVQWQKNKKSQTGVKSNGSNSKDNSYDPYADVPTL